MNENELEDLFRQAAEKYPLKTENGEWNKVVCALDDDESVPIFPLYFSFPCINGMEMESMPIISFGLNAGTVHKIR